MERSKLGLQINFTFAETVSCFVVVLPFLLFTHLIHLISWETRGRIIELLLIYFHHKSLGWHWHSTDFNFEEQLSPKTFSDCSASLCISRLHKYNLTNAYLPRIKNKSRWDSKSEKMLNSCFCRQTMLPATASSDNVCISVNSMVTLLLTVITNI